MKLHRKIAKYFGYDLINVRKSHQTLEVHLPKLLEFLNINVVLDVGANLGQYAKYLRRIGYTGHIFSFEPVRQCYALLTQEAARDAKWHTCNMALGNSVGQQSINVATSSDFSSFFVPNQFSQQQFNALSKVASVETVEMQRLDSVYAGLLEGIDAPRTFIKMDTQGYDVEVIRGASGILHQVLGLQSEVSLLPIHDDMPSFIEALGVYQAAGFYITGLYPVSRVKNSLRVVEYDCLMART